MMRSPWLLPSECDVLQWALDLSARPSERVERVPQVGDALLVEFAGASDLATDGEHLLADRFPFRGEIHEDAPLVGNVPGAGDLAGRLEPLEERCEGARVHAELGAKVTHR
jgi:hypothetical protein